MKNLDKWGKLVVERLLDEGVEYAETLLAGKWKAPGLQPLQRDLSAFNAEQRAVVLRCVRSTLDTTVHAYLVGLREALEDGDVRVTLGKTDLAKLEDNLEGHLYGEGGWIEKFSRYGAAPDED